MLSPNYIPQSTFSFHLHFCGCSSNHHLFSSVPTQQPPDWSHDLHLCLTHSPSWEQPEWYCWRADQTFISNAIVASHTRRTWSKHLTLCRCAPAFCFILLYSLLHSTCLRHTGLLSACWLFSNLLWFQWFCIHCFFCLELLPQIFTSLPPSHHSTFNSNVSASGFLSQLSYRKQLLLYYLSFYPI